MSIFNNHQDRPGWAYVEANELYYRQIHMNEVRDEDVEHDYTTRGLWVNLQSPTATLMTLKGVSFLNTKHQAYKNYGQTEHAPVTDLDTKPPARTRARRTK
jgi:hypothetical protein